MERDFFRRRFIGWSFRVRYRVVGDVGDTVPLFPSCLSNLASGKIPPLFPFFPRPSIIAFNKIEVPQGVVLHCESLFVMGY